MFGRTHNIKKRTIQLGIPLILGLSILPLLVMGDMFILGQNPDPSGYSYCLERILGGAGMPMPYDHPYIPCPAYAINNGYYFFHIMITGFILFYTIVHLIKTDLKKNIIAMLILTLGTALMLEYLPVIPPFWLQYGPIAAAFMLFGAYIRQFDIVNWAESRPFKEKKYWIALISSFIIGAALVVIFPPGTSFESNILGAYGGWSAFPYFITCCVTSMFFALAVVLLMKIPIIPSVLSLIGKHTLGILAFHIAVLKFMIAPFYDLDTGSVFPVMPMGVIIVLWILSLIICILISIYGMRLVRRLIAGYKNRNRTSDTAE